MTSQAGAQPTLSDNTLLSALKNYREQPTGSDISDDELERFFSRVIRPNKGNGPPEPHWFCERASPVARESATFLIRLFAHAENGPVLVYKNALRKVLATCELCVCAFQEAKAASRTSYLKAFPEEILNNFFKSIEASEAAMITKALEETVAENMRKTTLLMCLLNPNHTTKSDFAAAIVSQLPPEPDFSFVPAGLMLLLFHSASHVRQWARDAIQGLKPLPGKSYNDEPYRLALEKIFRRLSALHEGLDDNDQPPGPTFFTDNINDFWESMPWLLRPLTLDTITSYAGTMPAILSHLNDRGSHFPNVLKSLRLLLTHKSDRLWQTATTTTLVNHENPQASYPSIIFDAIKDNEAFHRLIQLQTEGQQQSANVWSLNVLVVFTVKVAEDTHAAFPDVLAKMAAFTLEELQHTRFKSASPYAVQAMMKTISDVLKSGSCDPRTSAVIRDIVERHDDFIASVAFSQSYQTFEVQWKAARQSSRELLTRILKNDSGRIGKCIMHIANAVGTKDPLPEPAQTALHNVLQTKPQFWVKIVEKLAPSDHDALRSLLSPMAQTASFSFLEPTAYRSSDSGKQAQLTPSIDAVNAFLKQSRQSFVSFTTKSSELSSSASLRRFLYEPQVVTEIITLILSPDDDVQQAALALVSQGFDVEERSECLRCLFENFPEEALGALAASITTFNEHVLTLREATKFAQALVLVLNDVLDVLFSQPSGLFLDEKVRSRMTGEGREATVAELWKLMTESMSNLFTALTNWSRVVPEKKQALILLIRDSLIFMREFLEQRQVVRKVLEPQEGSKSAFPSPRKLSRKGIRMIENLQPVLTASLKLLRLTDMELLHQSCRLVESLFDVFHESRLPPHPESVEKLKSILEQARSTQSTKKNTDAQSRLNESQISSLTLKVAEPSSEEEEDDEITFLGISKALKTASKSSPTPTSSAAPSAAPSRESSIKPLPAPQDHSKSKNLIQSSKTPKPPIATSSVIRGKPIPPPKSSAIMLPVVQTKKLGQLARAAAALSSSESDSDEDEKGIAALDRHQKSPVKVKERRGVKLLGIPEKTNNISRPRFTPQEEAQRQAMRLKPDVSGLYRMILQWDYEHNGPNPPDFEKSRKHLQNVPSQFKSPEHYTQVFEPLLRLECWSSLMKSKDDPIEQIRCKVLTKGYVDQFLEMQISIPQPPDPHWFLSETDIILLRRASGGKGLLGKVQEMKRGKTITVGLKFYNTAMLQKESPSAEHDYHVSRVFSLSTINREYAALKALPFYDLCDDILAGRVNKAAPLSPVDIKKTMEMQKVNEPQARSILSSMSTRGFSLIQGPPGTGKTLTICGIIGAFISSRPAQGTQVQAGKLSGSGERVPKKRILLCAPSNAAIDEVAKRIRDGVIDATGRRIKVSVVRIGADSSINISVKDISLDYLVDQRLEGANADSGGASSNDVVQIASLRSSLEGLKKQKQAKVDELNAVRNNSARTTELEKNISQLNGERQRLIQRLNKMQDEQKAKNRALDATRRRVRLETLLDADVICSTLSGSGHEVLAQFEFDTVVIDEAAQSIELSSLIPLKYRCTRCILVGDPKQLPPTVLSTVATQYRYNHSLFSRLENLRQDAVHLLSIQYRMHPDISKLPSQLFYDSRLRDGPEMASKTIQPWHVNPMFQPYRFFDVPDGNEEGASSGHSLINRGECKVAVALYRRLITEFPNVDFDFRIGIVSMYRAQIQELKSAFRAQFGKDIVGKIDFSTVDGFQGQEKDIIILSCVRGGPSVTSVGFLRDERRMNVSITRARSNLFILGHATSLERCDDFWKQIVQDARERGSLLKTDPQFFQRRTVELPPPVVKAKPSPKKSIEPIKPSDAATRQNLQTPRDLAANQKGKKRDPLMGISASSSNSSVPVRRMSPVPASAKSSSSSAVQLGTRKQDSASLPSASIAGTEANSTIQQSEAIDGPSRPAPPRPPPIKRQKPKPSLFLPKRPLSTDTSGNSNAKRRRL